MYDTLWIGCSHSAGMYNHANDIIDVNKGIANRIAEHYNQSWKILSFPGEGNFTFMEAVKVLNDRDMIKQFRNVIVQQTYEPRLNFYTNDAYKKQLDSVVIHIQYDGPEINKTLNAANGIHDKKVFSIIGRELYDAHADNFINEKINFVDVSAKISGEIDPRNPELEFYAEWSKAALDYIKLVSENNGCNFYTFKWFGSYNTQPKTYPKKGLFTGEEDMFTLIREAGLVSELSKPGSHPTEKILEFAFDKLISELEEIGYK